MSDKAYNPNKYDIGADDIVKKLRIDRKLEESVTKKRQQKQVTGDPYVNLMENQFEYQKERDAKMDQAAADQAQTQGLVGGMQSGIQTAFGSQDQNQALGGALTTGLQIGMATGNPYIGAAAALGSYFVGSKNAKKAEAEKKKAEAEKKKAEKLKNMRQALSDYSTQRSKAMQNLMTVLS